MRDIGHGTYRDLVENANRLWEQYLRCKADWNSQTAPSRVVLQLIDDVGRVLDQIRHCCDADPEQDRAELDILTMHAHGAATFMLLNSSWLEPVAQERLRQFLDRFPAPAGSSRYRFTDYSFTVR